MSRYRVRLESPTCSQSSFFFKVEVQHTEAADAAECSSQSSQSKREVQTVNTGCKRAQNKTTYKQENIN